MDIYLKEVIEEILQEGHLEIVRKMLKFCECTIPKKDFEHYMNRIKDLEK